MVVAHGDSLSGARLPSRLSESRIKLNQRITDRRAGKGDVRLGASKILDDLCEIEVGADVVVIVN
jgi:hypothetical protein